MLRDKKIKVTLNSHSQGHNKKSEKGKNHNSIAFKVIDTISPFTFLKLLTHCSTRGLTNPDVTTRATPNEENRALMITQPSSNAHTHTVQPTCNGSGEKGVTILIEGGFKCISTKWPYRA